MYSKIYEFCKVKNEGSILFNSPNVPTPRVLYIMDLLKSENIPFSLDRFVKNNTVGYNVIMEGPSSKMISAHHDIVNENSDNANDNSCSVINAIMVKKLVPDVNVVLLDGEEFGGMGSDRMSDRINSGHFGPIDWVLNLELTGKGGDNFFIGNYKGPLFNHILSLFNCPIFNTPFNDSVNFRKNGIDSCVINSLPITEKDSVLEYRSKKLDFSILRNCHKIDDSLSTIDIIDMQEFVEKVLIEILK
jgi:hypothetical protein